VAPLGFTTALNTEASALVGVTDSAISGVAACSVRTTQVLVLSFLADAATV
jgi:hypothetical protein